MLDTMKKEFPSSVKCTNPEGGLFAWVTLPESVDAYNCLRRPWSRRLRLFPGSLSILTAEMQIIVRLNYSCMNEDKIVEGIKRLGKL